MRQYHSAWIAAAEAGEITWETASMLMEAFELGVTETAEALRNSVVSVCSLSDEAIQTKNDSFQYVRNKGKSIKFPPSSLNRETRCAEINKEISQTVNFKSRKLHASLKIK